MTSKLKEFFCFLALFGVCLVNGALDLLPENNVAFIDDTITLNCRAASLGARVMWAEYVTNQQGSVISDNRGILPSHPNAARYAITGAGLDFNLQISNLTLFDGGKYLCQDIQGSPPATVQGSAEIIVLQSDPICTDFPTVTGALVEGRLYQQECEIYYRGNFVPQMIWSGPGVFDVDRAVTETSVWSMVSFTADRSIAGGEFQCNTSFVVPPDSPPEGATNNPDYFHLSPSSPVVVQWGPANVTVTPIKPFYVAGDTLTCTADSNPASNFRWQNMRTLDIEPANPVFTVTPELEGFDQVLRCRASIVIEGSLYAQDIFVNVSVPEITTPVTGVSTTPTTPPPADAPCTDLTGQWGSTNPNAQLCIEMDSKGNLLTLIRNGSDTFFVPGNGKTMVNDFKHIGFSGLWPASESGGAAGFAGECHRCSGNEVILLSGLARNKNQSPDCGLSAGTSLTRLYVLTRFGPPCRNLAAKVYRPSPEHIKYMQIDPKNIIL
jgi:hypothetical protein